MTNPHAALTTISSVPTMTLANYAYGGEYGGSGAGSKSAKIEYTANDDFIITSRQGSADADDTMTISDGTTTFNTNMSLGGGGVKIPYNIGNGSNQQVLTSDGNGNVSWDDANASTVSVSDSGNTDTTLRLILSDGYGQPELINDEQLTFNTSSNLLTVGGDIVVNGSDITLGNGANSNLQVEAVEGTDVAGKNLTLSAGQGTGSGDGGSLLFRVADGGVSGDSANSLATALTIASDKTATFAGDLVVNGTTTTVNSTTVTVDDPIFTLGGDSAPESDDNKDRGIEFRYHNGTAAKVGFFGFDDDQSLFTFIPDASNSSEVMDGTIGDALFTKIYFSDKGDEHISGDGTTLSITGNTSSLVSTSGALTLTSAAACTWSSTAGDLTVSSAAGSLNLSGAEADAAAVRINASNAAGGIDMDAGTGGIAIDTTGVLSLDSADDSNVTVTGAAKSLTLAAAGGGEQTVTVNSAGTGANAIDINATAGGIDIDASGAIAIDSSAGSISVGSTLADGQTLTLGKNGATEMVFTPHGTAGSETITLTNTAGTDEAAIALTSTAGGIDIDAAAAKDVNIAGGQVALVSKDDAASAISLTTNQGTSETIVLTNTQGTDEAAIALTSTAGGVDIDAAAAKDVNIAGGQVALVSKDDAASAISLTTNIGTSETITVTNTLGTAASAINLEASAGGVLVSADGDIADAIKLHATAGTSQTINLLNTAGTGDAAIALTSTAGGVDIDAAAAKDVNISGGQVALVSKDDAASAISLTTNQGTSETIAVTNTQGNGAGAITLTATAGGVDIDAGTSFDVDAAGAVSIDSTAGSITMGAVLADGQTLSLGKNGATEMVFSPHDTAGSETITLTNTAGTAAGAIAVSAVAGGITMDAAGPLSLDSTDDSNLTVTGAGKDLNLVVAGGGAQTLIASCAGTGADAVQLTASAGGMDVTAAKDIDITTSANNGNVNVVLNGTGSLVVGANTSGHDVKFFGASDGKYMLWDESSDTLEVQGTVQATNVIAVSDGNLKKNITNLNDPLATINKLHGVQYDWKDPNNTDHEIGLIAQDVEKVVPEVVRHLAGTNYKGVEYQKLTAILIEAVKELSNKVDRLESN